MIYSRLINNRRLTPIFNICTFHSETLVDPITVNNVINIYTSFLNKKTSSKDLLLESVDEKSEIFR